MASAKKEIKLEWYVLNSNYGRWDGNKEFEKFPYCFHQTNIRPWNVFNNISFNEAAIKLAKDYYKGKFNLETLRQETTHSRFDNETKAFVTFVDPVVESFKNDFEAFKYKLLKLLQYEEWSRCEYEILVAEWPPKTDKNGDAEADKVDTFTQVLPNADIFAKYVLMTVNGTLDKKIDKNGKEIKNKRNLTKEKVKK